MPTCTKVLVTIPSWTWKRLKTHRDLSSQEWHKKNSSRTTFEDRKRPKTPNETEATYPGVRQYIVVSYRKNLHVQDYFFYTAIPPGFIEPKEINNGEMAPYAELKISKRTFKELPFLPFIAREKILKNLLVRMKQCRSTEDSLQPEGVVYTVYPFNSISLCVFSLAWPLACFQMPRTSSSHIAPVFEFDI